MTKLIVALPADLLKAQLVASLVAPHCDMVKVRQNFLLRNGPQAMKAIGRRGLMLDQRLKVTFRSSAKRRSHSSESISRSWIPLGSPWQKREISGKRSF